MSLSYPSAASSDPRTLAQRLRHRISFQAAVETTDGAGGTSRSWSEVAELWAEIIPIQAGRFERIFAEQMAARMSHRITIRYRNDVTTAHRIVYNGRSFNIRSVVNVGEAGVILDILAEEGVAT